MVERAEGLRVGADVRVAFAAQDRSKTVALVPRSAWGPRRPRAAARACSGGPSPGSRFWKVCTRAGGSPVRLMYRSSVVGSRRYPLRGDPQSDPAIAGGGQRTKKRSSSVRCGVAVRSRWTPA